MKVEINRSGVLNVIAENETEVYALDQWEAYATITINHNDIHSITMKGDQHWRKGSISIKRHLPDEVPE